MQCRRAAYDGAVSAPFEPCTDELLANNASFALNFDAARQAVSPRRHLAVVTCMDSRMDVFQILGLRNGEAHIVRNAGGVITEDVIRSLCLSQRKMGTREILLIHHTDCGLQKVSDDSFKAEIERDIGVRPAWAVESFTDPFADVHQSIQRLNRTPFLSYKDHIRGFVYDVDTAALNEVLVEAETS